MGGNKVIKYFHDKKFNVKPVCDTAIKYKARIALLFLGKSSEVLPTQLKELFKKISWCSIQIVFTINYRTGNLFRFKDKLPSSLRSKIVCFFSNVVDATLVMSVLQNDTKRYGSK